MKKADIRNYPPFEAYKQWEKAFASFATAILFSLAGMPRNIKITIISNFIARAVIALKGVFQLWEIEDYQDCWVIYRCMLDRLFHLHDLIAKDEFELFERWSFMRLYDDRNKIRSDQSLKTKIDPKFFKDSPEDKQRYQDLLKCKPKWERPFAEEVAKRMKLEPLYKYGYDYASTLVHPMANDGEFDFVLLTKLGDKNDFADQFTVIQNSCHIAWVVLQEGLLGTGFHWRKIVNVCLDDFFKFLEDGMYAYRLSLAKVIKLGPDVKLCKVPSGGG